MGPAEAVAPVVSVLAVGLLAAAVFFHRNDQRQEPGPAAFGRTERAVLGTTASLYALAFSQSSLRPVLTRGEAPHSAAVLRYFVEQAKYLSRLSWM